MNSWLGLLYFSLVSAQSEKSIIRLTVVPKAIETVERLCWVAILGVNMFRKAYEPFPLVISLKL
jgi:hypothetical protein